MISLFYNSILGLAFAMAAAVPAHAQSKKATIRVGVDASLFSGLSSGDAKLTMLQIVEMAGFESNDKLDATFLPDQESFYKAVRDEEIDFFPILAHQYLKRGKEIDIEPVASAIMNGDSPYMNFVLLTADPNVTLSGLAKKSIAIDHSRSHGLEKIWLETIFLEAGLGLPEDALDEIERVNKPSKAIFPTFFGKSDLCLVTRQNWEILSELNPQLMQKMNVLAESDPLMPMFFGFRKGFDPVAKKQFLDQVVKMHETPEGKQILTLSKTKRIAAYKNEWLEAVEALVRRHTELKAELLETKEVEK